MEFWSVFFQSTGTLIREQRVTQYFGNFPQIFIAIDSRKKRKIKFQDYCFNHDNKASPDLFV